MLIATNEEKVVSPVLALIVLLAYLGSALLLRNPLAWDASFSSRRMTIIVIATSIQTAYGTEKHNACTMKQVQNIESVKKHFPSLPPTFYDHDHVIVSPILTF